MSDQNNAQPQDGQHSDDTAVDRFAVAMKEKLAKAREKGRSGWEQCNPADLSYMLREHVEKGDPRDVANFCMFLWSLGLPIGDTVLPTDDQIKKAIQELDECEAFNDDGVTKEAIAIIRKLFAPSPAAAHPAADYQDARDAARWRAMRATTTALRNTNGERLECTPEELDAAADAYIAKQAADVAAAKDNPCS